MRKQSRATRLSRQRNSCLASPRRITFHSQPNVAIIIVALLIGGVFLKKFLLDNGSQPPLKITAGTKVPLPHVDWAKNGQTLLLVLQKGRHFCAESAPFYQGLTREMESSGSTKLIAVLPQEVNVGQQYFADLKVPISEVKR
jgi:hypothetical protein